ncbi:MAG: hypothetical protein LUM44_07730 [Pyrinomonadaceae bacterium]|nr:hypothetical protein [Pyrinomonadaceae bacterium]
MNPVEQLKSEYESIAEYLKSNNEISLFSDLNKNFRKVLLLSAGSYFEHTVTSILSEFVRAKSEDERIVNFLEKQAISGKYHQLFSWGSKDKPEEPGKNANVFFKLFGDDFKAAIDGELKAKNGETAAETAKREEINLSIAAFIEIGHLRNILVHSNFADYNYDQKTTDEIFELFKRAEPFIEYLREKLA